MTQEQKELLLKDLCGRLPYGVKCKVWYNDKTLNIKCTGIDFYTNTVNLDVPEDDNAKVYVDNIKPCLFHLSSMTEEQKLYLEWFTKYRLKDGNLVVARDEDDEYLHTNIYDYLSLIEWLNKNHFDYRGLIEKGVAIDATGLNVYN